MASMAYNLMYGWDPPVDPSWGLYRSGGLQDAHQHSGMNPTRCSILGTRVGKIGSPPERRKRLPMPFDGWHIDTLGDRGAVFNDAGQSIDLASSYTDFWPQCDPQSLAGQRLLGERGG